MKYDWNCVTATEELTLDFKDESDRNLVVKFYTMKEYIKKSIRVCVCFNNP